MPKQRSTILSYLTLILAAAALINSMLPNSPIAFGASNRQDAAAQAAAINAINRTFNYQGILRKPDRSLATNGEYTMTFRIYDIVTGGTLLHEEQKSNVQVRDGIFNVVLGDDKPIGDNVFATMPRYLGVAVGSDAEMLPRQRIHPVPWSLRAETAGRADTAGYADNTGHASVADGLVPGATVYTGFAYQNAEKRLNFSTGGAIDMWTETNDLWINTAGHTLLLNPWGDSGAVRVGHDLLVTGSVIGNCNCALALFALNIGQKTLESGDIVALRGVSQVDFQAQPVMNVDLADSTGMIIGVVQGGAELSQPSDDGSGNLSRSLVSKGETVQPGGYVTIITSGMAQVKMSANATLIQAGASLILAEQPGLARMNNAEAQIANNTQPSIVGMALENSQPGQQKIWVLVNPR